jgi:hypothetical protein
MKSEQETEVAATGSMGYACWLLLVLATLNSQINSTASLETCSGSVNFLKIK